MLSNAMNQPKSTIELGYMCPRRLSGPPILSLIIKMASLDHGCIYPVVRRLEITYKIVNLSPYIPS